MKENTLYDIKSLKTVIGRTANFGELAKDCVTFSNAQGGIIDIGIENGETFPPTSQLIPEDLSTVKLIAEGELDSEGQKRWTKYRIKT